MRAITNVIVTILKSDRYRYEWLCKPWNERKENDCRESGALLLRYIYSGVDGSILGIEDKLRFYKIPYDKAWEPAKAFPGGSEYHRILISGNSVTRDITYPMLGAPSSAQIKLAKKDVPDWLAQEGILEHLGVAIPKNVIDFVDRFYNDLPIDGEPDPFEMTPLSINS